MIRSFRDVMKSLGLVAITLVPTSSCVTSIDPGVELARRPSDDKEYYKSYMEATRGGDLIRDFGLSYSLRATYLYPGFRAQLARRLQELYLQDATGAFSEANSKSGFFVTVYGDERDSADLANTNHWTILLEGGKEGALRPVLVRKITDKQRWRNFFDSSTPWSTDYLVVFDVPAANPGAENLVEKPHAKLIIAHGEGKITMNW